MNYGRKVVSITKGWAGYLFPDEETERIANIRAQTCADCEHAEPVDGMDRVLKDPDNEEIEGMKCGVCHCPLSSKLRSMDETCPKGFW